MDHWDSKSFWTQIHSHCISSLLYPSRVHVLPSFSAPTRTVYTLREDESSFGISGYKKRKLASLFHHVAAHPYQELIVIGGAYSNHVVGILQLAREQRIPVKLLLKETPHKPTAGNFFLLSLLAHPEEIHWIDAQGWPKRNQVAATLIERPPGFVVPEGGFCPESIAGMATLWEEIKGHQLPIEKPFDHIFIDAGTGLSAAVLEALIAWESPHTFLHIISMADEPAQYRKKFQLVAQWLADWYSLPIPSYSNSQVYRPYTAQSFGSVNASVRQYCQSLARTEGILTDPIYSAKLYMNAQKIMAAANLQGDILIIHSGGGTGLMGFSSSFNF